MLPKFCFQTCLSLSVLSTMISMRTITMPYPDLGKTLILWLKSTGLIAVHKPLCFNRKRFNLCKKSSTGAIPAPQAYNQCSQQKIKTPTRRNGSGCLPETQHEIVHPQQTFSETLTVLCCFTALFQ